MPGLLARLKSSLKSSEADRIRRRRAINGFISRAIPFTRVLLFLVGYVWMLALPSPRLGRTTYIDENALQPSQVTTRWDWGDVHRADVYLGQLEELVNSNATSAQKAEFLKVEFEKMGIPAATQPYSFSTPQHEIAGFNAYAVLSAPRTSGTETMVISASWVSLIGEEDKTLNMRGVATVLALAKFLKGYSLWAKDIIFIISDGYLDGMHAWLSAYHGVSQSNLQYQPLSLTSGVIWTALNIDYPGHSFSHLGVFFEGLDGLLPNQDLLNSFETISRHTGGVPVVQYDHLDFRDSDSPKWLLELARGNLELKEYAVRAKNIGRHVKYQATGSPSGPHGLFHRYRIDAITIFAVPAMGPHGFHAIGRVVESTLRTMNNLLERLHASFFFYILTTPGTFLKIGHYLPSVVLISVALMFGGLREWNQAGWVEVIHQEPVEKEDSKRTNGPDRTWERRKRPVLNALLVMIATHAVGGLLFSVVSRGWTSKFLRTLLTFLHLQIAFRVVSWGISSTGLMQQPHRTSTAPLSSVLKAMNLCLASTVISVTVVLNFSLAALLSISLGLPLSLSASDGSRMTRELKCTAHLLLASGILAQLITGIFDVFWNWQVLRVWFAPFMFMVYVPLVLQSGLICTLSS
ncbi:Gaa1-domain-containing protein [Rickenella mellea]|uniref:Gaa1-domain-containing protein n=1 Tax=Rickenella mellea TaxID=50990 RepID=A0A4Y7Q2N3_9AGAM|nr:Gaa1-domain-containing protein [Rickenella mellea]